MKIATLVFLLATMPIFVGCNRASTHPAIVARYVCPMHPQITSDKPGSCPICGMDLVPVGNGQSRHDGAIVITPETRQRIGLTLGTVEKRRLIHEIRAAARIAVDETRLYHVNVKVNGWVEKLFVSTTGQYVHKGDPLLTIYSPELLNAQAEHLSASPAMRPAARRRLELLDMTDDEIARLEQTQKINKTLLLYAPASGYVLERNIAAGHRVSAGEQLMALADLSNVWADADIFQDEVSLVQTGATVQVTVGNETFTGKVSFISPLVDPATRTVTVRMAIPNPNARLKPEMWGTARLQVDLGERLAIPSGAVLRAGERTYAFKVGEADHLMPVEIKLGMRAGDWFELLSGLEAGEQVVTSANFLVDSESQLKAALAGMKP